MQKAMLPLVDRDGLTKPVLQIIAEEALESGIEEICVVTAPGDEAVYRSHFRNYAANLRSSYKGTEWAEEQARRIDRTRTSRCGSPFSPNPRATATPSGAHGHSCGTSRSCCFCATTFTSRRKPGGARDS